MSIQKNKYPISIILTITLILIITPVVASDTSGFYGQFVDRATSDDGAFMIKSTGNNTIFLFEKGNNVSTWSYNIHGNIWSAAISPDGEYIAIGSEGGRVFLFDQKGAVVWNKTFSNSAIRSIEFSPDSRYLDVSNFMNQAFYLSLDGNPATRPTVYSPTVNPVNSPVITAGQGTAMPDLSWLNSIVFANGNLMVILIAGLVIAGIFWCAISQKRQRGSDQSGTYFNILSLKNFAIFSVVLVLVSFLPDYYPVAEYAGLLRAGFGIGLACFLIAYFLYAVKSWGAGSRIGAVLMVAVPVFAYTLATTKIPASSSNVFMYIGIQFCLFALFSAAVLFVSDIIKRGLEGTFTGNRHSRYFAPDASYAFFGLLVVSAVAVNAGSMAIFWDNSHTILGSANIKPVEPAPSGAYTVMSTPVYSHTATFTPYSSTPVPTPAKNLLQFPKLTTYPYVYQGSRRSITFTTYGGLSEYFSKESHSYYHDFEKETIGELLKNDYQDENLRPLIQAIRQQSSNPDDQARIAISLVQHIPYNWNALYSSSTDWYYPYETLYNNKGVCADKSVLLAYLLNELGYDTVLFEFSQHMAVGIKTSSGHDFYGTGYAFIESTRPTIPTYIPDTYYGGFTITPDPHIIHLDEGKRSIDFSAEYRDAARMKQLESMGQVLDQVHYAEWQRITGYYDLQYDT